MQQTDDPINQLVVGRVYRLIVGKLIDEEGSLRLFEVEKSKRAFSGMFECVEVLHHTDINGAHVLLDGAFVRCGERNVDMFVLSPQFGATCFRTCLEIRIMSRTRYLYFEVEVTDVTRAREELLHVS